MDPSNVYEIEDFRPKLKEDLESSKHSTEPRGNLPDVKLNNDDSLGLGSGSDEQDISVVDDALQSSLLDVQPSDAVNDVKMLPDRHHRASSKRHFDEVNCMVKLEPLSDFGDFEADAIDSDTTKIGPVDEKIDIDPIISRGLGEIPVESSDSNRSEFDADDVKSPLLNQFSDSAEGLNVSFSIVRKELSPFSADTDLDGLKNDSKKKKKTTDVKPKTNTTHKPGKTLKVKKCNPITGEVVPEQLKKKEKTEPKSWENRWRPFLKENNLRYCNESTFRAEEKKRREIYEDGKLKQYTFEALYYLYKDERNLLNRQHKQKALIQASCKICNQKLFRKDWNHTFLFHGEDYLRTCAVCLGKNFSCDNDLTAHYRMTHFGDRRLPCNRCLKVFYSANELNNHILAHDYTDTVACLFCSFRFADEKTMMAHCEKDHSKRKLKIKKKYTGTCEVCGVVVSSPSQGGVNASLKAHHIKLHAPKEKAFKCHLCPKVFTAATLLATHHMRMHTPDNVRPFVCTIDNCNKGFKTNCNLRNHQTYHKPPRFKCNVCLKEFYWSPVLKSHKCPGASA